MAPSSAQHAFARRFEQVEGERHAAKAVAAAAARGWPPASAVSQAAPVASSGKAKAGADRGCSLPMAATALLLLLCVGSALLLIPTLFSSPPSTAFALVPVNYSDASVDTPRSVLEELEELFGGAVSAAHSTAAAAADLADSAAEAARDTAAAAIDVTESAAVGAREGIGAAAEVVASAVEAAEALRESLRSAAAAARDTAADAARSAGDAAADAARFATDGRLSSLTISSAVAVARLMVTTALAALGAIARAVRPVWDHCMLTLLLPPFGSLLFSRASGASLLSAGVVGHAALCGLIMGLMRAVTESSVRGLASLGEGESLNFFGADFLIRICISALAFWPLFPLPQPLVVRATAALACGAAAQLVVAAEAIARVSAPSLAGLAWRYRSALTLTVLVSLALAAATIANAADTTMLDSVPANRDEV
jgi:hypothetical protein